jgi:hypothetical protein
MNNQFDDCIYRPQGDQGQDPEMEAAPVEQVGYTEGSTGDGKNVEVNVEDANCHAKVVFDPQSKSLKPFVKFGTFGAMSDWPYDPYDTNVRDGLGGRRGMKDGRSLFVFKKVSEETFRHYLLFLRTRDRKWLHHARRSRV